MVGKLYASVRMESMQRKAFLYRSGRPTTRTESGPAARLLGYQIHEIIAVHHGVNDAVRVNDNHR